MSGALRVLLVEDSPTDAKLVMNELKRLGDVHFERVETPEAMRDSLARPWDVVLSDWSMPHFTALGALALLDESGLDLPFIIVSGTIGEETAVEGMRAGAHDYVLKDKLNRLTPAIERELRECKDRAARREAEAGRARAELALRQSEEQLRHAQKMEAVGRLAGGVAHDFNNVLSVILSYSDLIAADLKPADPLRADILEVRKAAERGANLTQQLLIFSRQKVVESKVVDLHEVLGSLENMIQRILGEDVTLVLVPPKTGGRVKVDPTHIEQVVLNLVVNARDAMPMGGKLTIETANVVLDADYALQHLPAKAGSYVMLAVTDSGSGMDRATQERIFEPFFTTKPVGKGTGLGLSTVFGIVQRSDGNMSVDSELGKGTTFKIYLPRTAGNVDSIAPTIAPATLRGTETILLVEDEEQVRIVVTNMLRRRGYTVLTASNGGEALLLCETHQAAIDMLLTDVVMPNMSGPELAKRLAATRPAMKVLCMSGYTDDTIVRHGIVEGGMAYIQKPITPISLTTKIREVLDKVVS